MESWILLAIAQWESSNTKMNPPAAISEIEHVEKVLDFKFPDDFKQLYLVVNGFPDLDWQEHSFCFWPLTMILNEFEESLDGNFIGFCDFLLASHSIGFLRNKTGIYKSYSYEEKIAETYREAIQMINSSDENIY